MDELHGHLMDTDVIIVGKDAVRISDLISRLQLILSEHGELPVYLCDGGGEGGLDASRLQVADEIRWTVTPADRAQGCRITGKFFMPKRLVIPTD